MKITGSTLNILERGMDVRLARHNVLGGNVANLDTPGFTPVDVDVRAAMQTAGSGSPAAAPLATTSSKHLGGGSSVAAGAQEEMPTVAADAAGLGLDKNGVDLDRTMASIAENALQYQATARITTRHLALLRYVASDGTA